MAEGMKLNSNMKMLKTAVQLQWTWHKVSQVLSTHLDPKYAEYEKECQTYENYVSNRP